MPSRQSPAMARKGAPLSVKRCFGQLDQAKADFAKAWAVFLAKRTEADFQEWRDQQEWTERKYAMWKRGERMPSQEPSSLITCPCGQVFDSHRLEETVIHVPHITASISTVH